MAKKASKKTGKKAGAKRAARKRPAVIEADEVVLPPLPEVRPLAEIAGHERPKRVLADAFRSGRVHHAWIFHGKDGVGKLTAALSFGALMLDPTTAMGGSGFPEADPESRAYSLASRGLHPDLHVVRRELAAVSEDAATRQSKQTTIAKKVIDEFFIRPATRGAAEASGGRVSKVLIVNEAELLDTSLTNAASQNAILKTLEEPPAGTLIILVASTLDRLLPTIRSRCQRVAFGPLSDEEMRGWIGSVELPRAVSGPDLDWLLSYSDGSPGRLIEALETDLLSWHRALSPRLDQAASGRFDPALGAMMDELIKAWSADQAKQRPGISKNLINAEAQDRMLALVADHARRGLVDAETAPASIVRLDAVGRVRRRLGSQIQPGTALNELASAYAAAGSDPVVL